MQKYKCAVCGYIYDEAVGIPNKGIPAGTKWGDIPADFQCPVCRAPKGVFALIADEVQGEKPGVGSENGVVDIMELSPGEISAICSNLAKGCEKQRLNAEMEAFAKLADYYRSKTPVEADSTLSRAARLLDEDIEKWLPAAQAAAKSKGDRGALRSLVWSEKVSAMLNSLLDRYEKEGDSMLADTNIYVCEICGFVYPGDEPPEICPVCKVPSFRIAPVERRESYAGV